MERMAGSDGGGGEGRKDFRSASRSLCGFETKAPVRQKSEREMINQQRSNRNKATRRRILVLDLERKRETPWRSNVVHGGVLTWMDSIFFPWRLRSRANTEREGRERVFALMCLPLFRE